MSRNFELLHQMEKARDLFPTPNRTPVADIGRRARLDPEALSREERVRLVQRVFLQPGNDAPRSVVFSGVEAGDGSSWICARAAEALASQVRSTVCVVDANLRSPSLHRYFGRENLAGLTEAVLQSEPIPHYAQLLEGGNLWLIPCGSLRSDPHSLLTSDRLRARMIELKDEFDYVLIDAPPMILYSIAIGKRANDKEARSP